MTITTDHPRARRPALLLTAVLLGAVLAACGGDGDGDDQGVPSETTTAAGGPVATDEVAIEDFAFGPESIRIRAGDTVTWTNRDDFDHTVGAEDRSFVSEAIPSGKTFTHTYADAGTFTYVCTIHPYMKATVAVE
ncbi:MAG TPA: cupredoxin family copper-binding protein [Acidimicrobiales bacterium]|nr:cupredoxin family copper-binding protein [Acidimicrobiales bacterium]